MIRRSLCLALALFAAVRALAQTADPQQWTPEAVVHAEYLQAPALSDDAQLLLWFKPEGNKKLDRFVRQLQLTRLQLPEQGAFRSQALTRGEHGASEAIFSPDGQYVYFLSSRDEGNKLWRMSLLGGEPEELYENKNGLSQLRWLAPHSIAFVSNDGKTRASLQAEEDKDNSVVVEDSVNWSIERVYAFHTETKKVRRLTDNAHPVSEYALSRDGRWLAATLTMSPHAASDAHPAPKTFLYDLQAGTNREVLQGLQMPFNLQFDAAGQGFYACATRSSDPEWAGAGIYELHYCRTATGQTVPVDLRHEWGTAGSYHVAGAGVLVSLANGPLQQYAYYAQAGESWKKLPAKFDHDAEHVSVMAVSKDGRKMVYQHSTAAQLPAYYVADLSTAGKAQASNAKTVVRLNAALQQKPRARYEIMKWKGYQGEEVNGLLYYPHDYQEGKQYPLMLAIHGGPSAVDQDEWSERWSYYPNLLAQKGMFVLMPNYHGSSHHGLAFVESIKKRYYEPELADIMAGIGELQRRGAIDTARVGTMGWSNGAILTTMLTVRYPGFFKVASAGAGDVNWTSDFGTCSFGVSFDQSYFGGAPWDDVGGKSYNETYILKSPLFELEKVTTPTLIFHGSEDRAVPRDQGWEYYRALQQSGKAPVRFLWFPGQGHGLRKITHQLRKMQEEIAWIETYLLGKAPAENPAFKPGSPLARLIKQGNFAHKDGTFGLKHGNFLIPEMVPLAPDSLEVARFEVTNAQFQSFDPRYYFPPQEANHPAMVDFDQAKAYVQWLNLHTGDDYRLPTAEEASAWQEVAHRVGGSENTLRYWAGYDLMLDQAAQFRRKLAEARLPLLLPVGSFAPAQLGRAEIYDLGGNVAEYAQDGQTYGYGANDYVDPASPLRPAKPSYKGIRVVREP